MSSHLPCSPTTPPTPSYPLTPPQSPMQRPTARLHKRVSQVCPYCACRDDGVWEAHEFLPVIRREDLPALQDGSKGRDGGLFLKGFHHFVAVLVPQTTVAVPDTVGVNLKGQMGVSEYLAICISLTGNTQVLPSPSSPPLAISNIPSFLPPYPNR